MFDLWYRNFKLLVRDTYGYGQSPFRTHTISELRQMYEAGKSEYDAIAELTGEMVEVDDD